MRRCYNEQMTPKEAADVLLDHYAHVLRTTNSLAEQTVDEHNLVGQLIHRAGINLDADPVAQAYLQRMAKEYAENELVLLDALWKLALDGLVRPRSGNGGGISYALTALGQARVKERP